MNKETISWTALEYEHKDRSPDWFWALGVITLSLAIAAIVYKNYLFAVFIILAAVVIVMYGLRRPRPFQVEVSKKGVKIGDDFYPYKKIKSFWIDTATAEKKLILRTERSLMPTIILPIAEGLEDTLKEALLSHHLAEEEMHEPVSHKVMEYLGF